MTGILKHLGKVRKLTRVLLPLATIASLLFLPGTFAAPVLAAAAAALFLKPDPKYRPGSYKVGRIVFALTPLVAFASAGEQPPALLSATILLVYLALAAEPYIGRAMRIERFDTASLPGSEQRALFTPGSMYYMSTAVLIALQVPAFIPETAPFAPVALLGFAPAAAVAALKLVGREGLLIDDIDERAARTKEALEKVRPSFLLYFAAPAGTSFQVAMWLPHLEKLDGDYFILVREAWAFNALQEVTDRPIVFARDLSLVDEVLPEGAKAVFYVNNAAKNTHMVRFPDLTHVQLLHGDSDKVSSFNPVTAMFDRIFVAGQAGLDRYPDNGIDIPEKKFDIVGRPQVAQLDITERAISEIDDPTVLYAPTWAGYFEDANYSSLGIGVEMLRELTARGTTVIFRPHPYTDRIPETARHKAAVEEFLRQDAAASGRRHRWGPEVNEDMTLFDCVDASDALISDVSSVVSDWLYSEKPFAVVDARFEREDFHLSCSLIYAAYRIEGDGSNMESVLDDLLEKDPLAEERRKAKVHYLGDFPPEEYEQAFINAANKYLK
ncbi:CDP-glycerol glycerophosphotransferase family protein [Salininema proteolyticum]|uniref:CDP-glycerol glycerophosphotransferase family protein n=1 Tax=Salininema proteolyticum TaxID=1607685 RepID=A0ABV8TX49_9ACTN